MPEEVYENCTNQLLERENEAIREYKWIFGFL